MLCRILSVILVVILFPFHTVLAAKALAPATELTNVRWANHIDGETGTQKVRLVVDVTGNVDVESVVDEKPIPRIVVNINGADIGKVSKKTSVDNNVVNNVSFHKISKKQTQMVIELPNRIENNNYHVFTLKSNPEAQKPFRVVVDVQNAANNKGLSDNTSTKVVARTTVKSKFSLNPASGPHLAKFLWANHLNINSGESTVRLVIESTGKVKFDSAISVMPQPRLIVNIAGANTGALDSEYWLDSEIAEKVTLRDMGNNNTQMMIDLPVLIGLKDFKVYTLPEDRVNNRPFRVVIDIKKPQPLPYRFKTGLKGKVIVIDPGHGGVDPGAVGLSRVMEKTVNLQVALQVQDLLEKAGAKVIMTRDCDREVASADANDAEELGARTAISNGQKVDVFVSIHANASSNRNAGGTSTYYFEKSRFDELLAQNLQVGMHTQAGLADRGVHEAGFFVIKRTIVPAALVEMAFISNSYEENLLTSPSFQKKMAQGIVNGLDNFFAQAAQFGGGK